MPSQLSRPLIYHIDSVESTSKWRRLRGMRLRQYTILTLWSQLQNNSVKTDEERKLIPYWLCGVNFKMMPWHGARSMPVYHIDSVESTSKYPLHTPHMPVPYTILTLWSQLQNKSPYWMVTFVGIPYWLCGVNFKIIPRFAVCVWKYTILTLWSQLQNGWSIVNALIAAIPYWLCGVNFKMEPG